MALLALGGVTLAVFVLSFCFSDSGWFELQQARSRVAAMRADIAKLEAQNARLRADVDSARRSTYAVERVAREELGMSRKGEVVYMIPKK